MTIAVSANLQLHAQSLTPHIVGSAGAFFESPNGSLSWTIGEPLTATYKNVNYLTQGFHQPTTITVTGSHLEEDEALAVYPNPVRDILYVQASRAAGYQIELFNMQGQRLVDQHAVMDELKRVHRIEVLEIPVALYILRITNSVSGETYYHKIEKY
jgi:hypothetical protein